MGYDSLPFFACCKKITFGSMHFSTFVSMDWWPLYLVKSFVLSVHTCFKNFIFSSMYSLHLLRCDIQSLGMVWWGLLRYLFLVFSCHIIHFYTIGRGAWGTNKYNILVNLVKELSLFVNHDLLYKFRSIDSLQGIWLFARLSRKRTCQKGGDFVVHYSTHLIL